MMSGLQTTIIRSEPGFRNKKHRPRNQLAFIKIAREVLDGIPFLIRLIERGRDDTDYQFLFHRHIQSVDDKVRCY